MTARAAAVFAVGLMVACGSSSSPTGTPAAAGSTATSAGAGSVAGATSSAGSGTGGASQAGASQAGASQAGASQAGASQAGASSIEIGERPWRPANGKSYLLIGQSGSRALVEYRTSTGSKAAGGSVYGDLYHGTLNNEAHLAFVDLLASEKQGAFVELGLSWKDAMAANGYIAIDGSQPANFRTVTIEEDIVKGKFDKEIDAIATLMKARPALRFLLRIDYEVSNNFHCNTDATKWNFDSKDCSYYVAAYNYVAKRIRETDATPNVAFVYHPVRGQAELLYPGAEYVDWVGFSVFNNDLCLPVTDDNGMTNGCPATSPADSGLVHDIEWAGTQGKPVLIAESSVQRATDQTATGFNGFLDRLFSLVNEYPQIGGLTYINIDWQNDWIPGEAWTGPFACDSRIQRFPETRARWCSELAKGRFLDSSGANVFCSAK